VKATAQNISRRLMETPANLMTPIIFADNAVNILRPLGVTVEVHDKMWAQKQGMGSFLCVAQGSAQPPVFLELTYKGKEDKSFPIVFVGEYAKYQSSDL